MANEKKQISRSPLVMIMCVSVNLYIRKLVIVFRNLKNCLEIRDLINKKKQPSYDKVFAIVKSR